MACCSTVEFIYDEKTDTFRCPVGQKLLRKQLSRKDRCVIYAAEAQVHSASAGSSITQPVSHSLNLSWTASSSSVAGYNIYRGTQSSGPFTKLNGTLETATVYTDTSVASGQTYATTTVNSSGVESGYSNVPQTTIP